MEHGVGVPVQTEMPAFRIQPRSNPHALGKEVSRTDWDPLSLLSPSLNGWGERRRSLVTTYLLVVVTLASGKSILPVPPPTSTLMCTEVSDPSFQPCFSQAAK